VEGSDHRVDGIKGLRVKMAWMEVVCIAEWEKLGNERKQRRRVIVGGVRHISRVVMAVKTIICNVSGGRDRNAG